VISLPPASKRFQQQIEKLDRWLAKGDIKRVEAHIVRLENREHTLTSERVELLQRLARARLLSARPEEALSDLQEALDLAPELRPRADVQSLLGDIYFSRFELAQVGFADRGDTERAITAYQAIAEADPYYDNLGWVLYQWGRVLLSRDRVAEAEAKFQEAIFKRTTLPNLNALCYERLGFICLMEKRDALGALTLFSRAVLAYPRSEPTGWLARLHLLRSRAYREQGQMDEALAVAQHSLTVVKLLDPDYRSVLAEAHLALGDILAEMPGREREAVDCLTQFLAESRRPQGIDVTWSRVHETLGELWFRQERYDLAIDAYFSALTYNPYHPMEVLIHYQIARSYFRQKDFEKTVSAVEQMMTAALNDGSPITDYRVYSMLASAHFALSHFAEATTAYQQALDLAPATAEQLEEIRTYLHSAQTLSQRGREPDGTAVGGGVSAQNAAPA
jgi:tetratricopeptide (TPR) repeat protein